MVVLESEVWDRVESWTLPTLLHRNARWYGDKPAITQGAETVTWAVLRESVAAMAHAFREIGLNHGDRLLIDSASRVEHWVVDLAAGHLGALSCTTYATLSTSQIRHIATHSAATVVVLEGERQLRRWKPVLDDLPDLRVVVLDEVAIPGEDPRPVDYNELLRNGAERHRRDPSVFEEWTEAVRQHEPLCMIYTSGTTGMPKGVVLSHSNVLYQAAAQELIQPSPDHPRMIAYLPLAHVAERVLGIYLMVFSAAHITICPDQTQLLSVLDAVRPHAFFGVPRVWEKIAAGVQGILASLPAEEREAVEQAREIASTVYRTRAEGSQPDTELAAAFEQADVTVLRPLREKLGLDHAERLGSGAAPIPGAVLEFLGSIGMTIMEVWGLSETTGAATSTYPHRYRAGTVGTAVPGMETRLAADGEVEVRGPLVFLGYLCSDGTIESGVDADGWLATGDVGTVDDEGLLTITDRKKELIVTSSGKNIAPSRAEGLLRTHPLIGYVAVIGDRRPYVAALVTLDEEEAPGWAAARGIATDALGDLARHPTVLAEIGQAVREANHQLARPEQIKKHRVLESPWTPESGELTPTMKLKRHIITERYGEEIEQLYATERKAEEP